MMFVEFVELEKNRKISWRKKEREKERGGFSRGRREKIKTS